MRKATSKGRRRPLRVNVGSTNPVKVGAVREVFKSIFSKEFNVRVAGIEVDSGVDGEPWEDDVLEGARNRAQAAIGDSDYGVGIEAGLINAFGEILGVQYCAIVDSKGAFTIGHGPGFRFPPEVLRLVEQGRNVSEAFEEITGIKDIGRKGGAVQYLTKGILDRTGLTEMAVLMAMMPRIRKDLY